MTTRFAQVLPNRGVDENVGPIPEMLVPLRRTNNILLLIDEGQKISVEDAVQVFNGLHTEKS